MTSSAQTSRSTPQETVSKPTTVASKEHKINHIQTLPNEETTLYRDPETVIRILPHPTPEYTATITLYTHITPETKHLTPKQNAGIQQTTGNANTTDAALPADLQETYQNTIDMIEENLHVTRDTPGDVYGTCHRKYEHVGKHGVVTMRTHVK